MSKQNEELARKLACAVISHHMDISYNHCYKQHIANTEVGEYWYKLADRVEQDWMQSTPSIGQISIGEASKK